MSIPIQVTFDCADPDRLAHFWADLLGYQLDSPRPATTRGRPGSRSRRPGERVELRQRLSDPDGRGPRIFFQRVPEQKQQKNRVHLDVNAGGPRGTPDDDAVRRSTPPSSEPSPWGRRSCALSRSAASATT